MPGRMRKMMVLALSVPLLAPLATSTSSYGQAEPAAKASDSAAAPAPAATPPATTAEAPPAPAVPTPVEAAPAVPAPVIPAPAAPEAATPPVAPAPAATAPAATAPVDASQPVASQPVATESSVTQPPATQVATIPSVTTQSVATQPATTQSVVTTQPANPALAERLMSMAGGLLRSQTLTPGIWRYAAGLLEAATRLAPDEPRYARALVEASLRAGDGDTAIRALAIYRKLEPTDQVAQVQQIDLYLGRMEESDAKVKYLRAIADAPSVAAPVRSVAAFRCAEVCAERMQDDQAEAMIDQALKLNPLNLDALRARLARQDSDGSSAEDRIATLLQMLQSNPAQPSVGVAVARTLADEGMVGRSIEWMNQSLELHRRMGVTPPIDAIRDFSVELFLAGDVRGASAVAQQLTTFNPDDLSAWLLRVILARASGDKDAYAATLKQATVAVTNRIAMLEQAAGDKGATTRPVDAPGDVPIPDPAAVVQKLTAAKNPELLQQFVPAAGTFAWLKTYFEQNAGQAVPWTKAIASISGENSEIVTRLQGWQFLAAGNRDDAKVKLSAVAAQDPLAALGLIVMAENKPEVQEKANAAARKLLADNPSGLKAALLFEALNSRGAKVVLSPEAGAIEKQLTQFPKDWLKIIDQPKLFYSLRLDPGGRVAVPVGEPILVRVSVRNVGTFPLTIGADGILHSDLWLDAQLRGAQQQTFAAEAYGRLTGPLVLLPKEEVSQVLRLDQAQLARQLEAFPTASFQISAWVMTNPSTVAGQISMGPAGDRAQLSKLMERTGAPIGQDAVRQKLATDLAEGTPIEKIRAVETMTKFATLLAAAQGNDVAKQMAFKAVEAVRMTAQDPDPAVRAWATYLYCVLSGDTTVVNVLLHDKSWISRALGIVAADYLGQSHDLFRPLAKEDPDPLVRRLASAAIEAEIRRPQQPAGAPPATAPAAAPGSSVVPLAPAPPSPSAPTTPSPTAPSPTTPSSDGTLLPPAAPQLPSPGAPSAPAAGPIPAPPPAPPASNPAPR